MITVTPVAPPSYTLIPNTQSVMERYRYAVADVNQLHRNGFVCDHRQFTQRNTLERLRQCSLVTLTNDGNGTSVLTITTNENAANRAPVAPWTSGGAIVFGAVMLGAPFAARRRKQIIAVLLTAVAMTLAVFSMACSTGGTAARSVNLGCTARRRHHLAPEALQTRHQ